VGFVLGITTLTGMGFKFSAFVIDLSGVVRAGVARPGAGRLAQPAQLTVLFGLMFTAIACIIMGSGVPTTPTYIILASIVAPALAQLGVPQLATHFFVFYYGVLADVTPPVALAAFAAAGIARSEPMRTGMTAFRLSMGKALVPFAFVYTPSLLFVNFSRCSSPPPCWASWWPSWGWGRPTPATAAGPSAGVWRSWLLNVLSLALVFGQPLRDGGGGAGWCLLILAWHARAARGGAIGPA
jgi:TRAP-type uncharacterized transport system fused permease subunit